MQTVSILLLYAIAVLVVETLVFYGFARLCRAGTVTPGRVFAASAAVFPIFIVVQFLLGLGRQGNSRISLSIAGAARLLEPFVALVLMAAVAKVLLRASYGRTLLALILSWVTIGLPAQIALRDYIGQTYTLYGNSMAPALRGWHWINECPECQGKLIVPAHPPGMEKRQWLELPSICETCRGVFDVENVGAELQSPDTVITLKCLRPRRWDFVVFVRPDSDPENPTINVARLVGLPKEEVEIRDHGIWINGAAAVAPEEMKGVRFLSAEEVRNPSGFDHWDTGADDFILLGDFSDIASDSRFFGAVSRAGIIGVVTGCRRADGSFSLWR